VSTVEDTRRLRGQVAGGHTKNLFLMDRREAVFLVVAPEDATVELKTLHRRLDAGRPMTPRVCGGRERRLRRIRLHSCAG
jgi:hypothetical protein